MAFNKNKPAASTSLRNSNPEILENWSTIETALNREHEFSTGGTVTDQAHHKKGSARCFIQDAAPTARRDGTAFTAEDNGSLWIDTNSSPDNQFNFLEAFAGPTWTPISTEVIAVIVAAIHTWAAVQTFSEIPVFTKGLYANNAFLVARNAAGNGNVNLIKADGSDVPVVPDGTETATNAAPSSDKDLANKKYIDDSSDFQTKTTTDSTSDTIVHTNSYKAQVDGFVSAMNSGVTEATIKGYTNTSDNPENSESNLVAQNKGAPPHIFFAVAKDEYFTVTGSNANRIIWWSVGTASPPVDQD